MQHKIMKVLAIIGFAVFIYFFIKINPVKIGRIILEVSWFHIIILIAMRFIFWIIRTKNWQCVLKAYKTPISFWHLFNARIAGHAIGFLTPSSKIGGEILKVLMVNSNSKKKITNKVQLKSG